MIRRIIHELNVRALASDVRRRAVSTLHQHVYADLYRTDGCIILGARPHGIGGVGYMLSDASADNWPDGARLLTIGRVTLAAWGGRSS